MLDGMSDSIQRSRIEYLHSREVDRQSPTGLIFSMITSLQFCMNSVLFFPTDYIVWRRGCSNHFVTMCVRVCMLAG